MSQEIDDIKNQELDEDSIDWKIIWGYVKRLWSKRRFIICITLCFMLLGLFVALFSPNVYEAGCMFVPQSASKSKKGGVTALAAMAGINLNSAEEGGETVSPLVYPDLLNNVNFQKELLHSKIKFQKWGEPIELIDYYTDPKYGKFNFLGVIKRYTIGLPGVIIGAIRPKSEPISIEGLEVTLNQLTENEYLCLKEILPEIVNMGIDEKIGHFTLSVSMPEAAAAAQVAQISFTLLQKYITELKIEKATANLDFIQARHDEAKKEFQEKQREYTAFLDANIVLSTASAIARKQQFETEFNLANTLYIELSQQLLKAQLKVKEDTPVLTLIKPVVVPQEKSKPKRAKILMIYTFLGVFLGCAGVWGLDWLEKQGKNVSTDRYEEKIMRVFKRKNSRKSTQQ